MSPKYGGYIKQKSVNKDKRFRRYSHTLIHTHTHTGKKGNYGYFA